VNTLESPLSIHHSPSKSLQHGGRAGMEEGSKNSFRLETDVEDP
jgi:hypothetical protein